GRDRNMRKQPLRSALDAGVALALSTDAPVIEPDWRRTMAAAMERNLRDEPDYRDDQRLTAVQALAAMSQAGAWQCHEESWRGSIAAGMAADLVILDRQVDWSDAQAVLAAQVETELIDGAVVHGELGRMS
ncbi:MAG: amidohydrolase family protein, partial [Actinomycetales bacterium]